MRKKIHVFVAIVCVLICMAASSVVVSAAPCVYANKLSLLYYPKEKSFNNYDEICFLFCTKNTSVKNLKSSNAKIATAKWSKKSPEMVAFRTKGAGKVVVSGDLYEGKKLVKRFKIKLTVHKYVNPLKSFKINGKENVKRFNKKDLIYHEAKVKNGEKVKVSVKPKAGWKIEGISYERIWTDKSTPVKNGRTITIENGPKNRDTYLEVTLYNKTKKLYTYVSYFFTDIDRSAAN